jgi:hypothetical protein
MFASANAARVPEGSDRKLQKEGAQQLPAGLTLKRHPRVHEGRQARADLLQRVKGGTGMSVEQGLNLLMLIATLAAFATFAVVAWMGIRQRENECRLDPNKC